MKDKGRERKGERKKAGGRCANIASVIGGCIMPRQEGGNMMTASYTKKKIKAKCIYD